MLPVLIRILFLATLRLALVIPSLVLSGTQGNGGCAKRCEEQRQPWSVALVYLTFNKFLTSAQYVLATLLSLWDTTVMDKSLFYISKSPFTGAL